MDNPSYKKCKHNPWKEEHKTHLIFSFRDFELSKVVLFADDLTEPIEKFVTTLLSLEVSSSRYQDYYWDIKKLLTGYVNCCHHITESTLPFECTISNIDKPAFNMYITETKNSQTAKQDKFYSCLQSLNISAVMEEYDEKLQVYMNTLDEMEAVVEKFNRPVPFLRYAREQFERTLNWLDDLYQFGVTQISAILYKTNKLIHASLEENYNIQIKNINKMDQQYTTTLTTLQQNVYKARKTWLAYSRRYCPKWGDREEIDKSIKQAQAILHNFKAEKCPQRQELEKNKDYFGKAIASLEEICQRVREIEEVSKSIENKKNETAKLHDLKRERIMQHENKVYQEVELNYVQDRFDEFLQEYKVQMGIFDSKYINARNALLTFFYVNGKTRSMHIDEIGKFYIDEYGRQIYSGNFGMDLHCVCKDGDFKKLERDKGYAYDCNGRYIEESGRNLYKRTLNGSCYELTKLEVMNKVPKQCPEPYNPVETPKLEKGALSREDVDYLWEVLAPCLPKSLQEVCKLKPKHYEYGLAHRLITCNYGCNVLYGPNEQQRKQDKEENIKWKEDLIARKREALVRASEKWKALQMKRPAPKDFEDPHSAMIQCTVLQQQMIAANNQL